MNLRLYAFAFFLTEINETVINVIPTSFELEEAKTTIDICAELDVTEVQIKTIARFAVLLDTSLLGKLSLCVCLENTTNSVGLDFQYIIRPLLCSATVHP